MIAVGALLGVGFALTAGPAVAEIRFEEVSAAWGIDFRHHHGASGEFYMIETMGSGVVIFDYDGDGDRDLFFVDSGALPGRAPVGGSRLFRNDGEGRFVDATAVSGLVVSGYGMGATAGDVDADGDLDLYVTAFGANQLFRNDGDGRFTDVTEEARVGDPRWSASAAFADVDVDGDLDLYVTNYVDFGFDNNLRCGSPLRKLRSYCHPDVYSGLPDVFYRNRGDGSFEERTEVSGFGDARGNGLGVVFGDLDGDGLADLYVANDMSANFLYRNLGSVGGEARFEDVALLAGTAFGDRGEVEAGMGVELGDLDGDGRADLFVTHLDLQTNALYSATEGGVFRDRRFVSRLAEPSLNKVGFGVGFGDFDLDGELDVVVANGHIIHNIEKWQGGGTYRQVNQVFRNLGEGRFTEVEGSGLDVVRSSRGLALGDLDGDGRLDLAISNSNEGAEIYRGVGSGGDRLELDVLSAPGLAAIGARVEAGWPGGGARREVKTASSYLSQSQLTLHLGTGTATAIDLRVAWPDGGSRRLVGIPTGHRLRISR